MDDEKVRLSVDLSKQDHKLLKLECSKRDLTPKLRIQDLVVEWLEYLQDSKKGKELEEIHLKNRWVCFEELRRREGWDAL